MEKKRLTAIKTRIEPAVSGSYVAQEGFNPNYVLTQQGLRLSRIRVLATVVDKFLSEGGKFASLTLDDGTATVRAKIFTAISMFDGIEKGALLDVTGRIKEYQGEIYIQPEVIRQIEDPNFEILRELEIREQDRELEKKRKLVLEYQQQVSDLSELSRLMKERFNIEPEETESLLAAKAPTKESNARQAILAMIESLDSGEGCNYSDLIEASGLPEDVLDSTISDLMQEGLCFEPRPGKIKKL